MQNKIIFVININILRRKIFRKKFNAGRCVSFGDFSSIMELKHINNKNVINLCDQAL